MISHLAQNAGSTSSAATKSQYSMNDARKSCFFKTAAQYQTSEPVSTGGYLANKVHL